MDSATYEARNPYGANACAACAGGAASTYEGGQLIMMQAGSDAVLPSPYPFGRGAASGDEPVPDMPSAADPQELPNAKKGLKAMFDGQRLLVAALVIVAVVVLGSIIPFIGYLTYPIAVIGGFSVVPLAIAGFVYKIVGCYRASRDEKRFLPAFVLGLVALGSAVAILAMSIMMATGQGHMSIADMMALDSSGTVLGIAFAVALEAMDLFMNWGIVRLSRMHGSKKMVNMGFAVIAVAVGACLLINVMPEPSGMYAPDSSLLLYLAVSLAVAYVPPILQLVYLSRARRLIG